MVLAKSIRFKRGLYKSCGVMLEPCLLQPCFHVASEGPREGLPGQGPLSEPCAAPSTTGHTLSETGAQVHAMSNTST